MWRLDSPSASVRESYVASSQNVRDLALRQRFAAEEGAVVAASTTYEIAVRNTSLHRLRSSNFQLAQVSSDEMVWLYDNRMARRGGPGRKIYDQLMLLPESGRCPLCFQRTVSTLDHHLPKSRFPALAVTPLNLIPACSECNRLKRNATPARAEDETFNPYFENLENVQWLRSRVVQQVPASLLFFVDPPPTWPAVLAHRVRRHFSNFGLGPLYSSHAAQELSNIRHRLSVLYATGGTHSVRAHLRAEAASRMANHINSWQTAAYYAISMDDWFCEGGFAS
jgi:5-methylcytosine-specific restriction endonuclease McrA